MQLARLTIPLATLLISFSLSAHADKTMHDKTKDSGHHHAGMMQMMDTNSDGNINKVEFDAFHNQHFVEMDKNNDGNVNKEEMKTFHQNMHNKMSKKHSDKMHDTHHSPNSESSMTPSHNNAKKSGMEE